VQVDESEQVVLIKTLAGWEYQAIS